MNRTSNFLRFLSVALLLFCTFALFAALPSEAATPQIAAGTFHTITLKSDGTLWAWGENSVGQLGDGTTADKTTPTRIGTDNKWVSIAAGGGHTIALKSDGTLWAWGRNLDGELGDGTTTNKNTPTQIGTDNKWVSIAVAAGDAHTIALKSDGTLWAWGWNGYGQLGDGTTDEKWTPTQIGSDNNWVSISAGGYHNSIALKSDGTLWAWGNNQFGQLGDGTTANKNTPTQIGTDNKWVSIAGGFGYTIALKSDGTLWAWGGNDYGQLGDGTTDYKTTPTQIGSDNKWVSIAAGWYHTIALKSDGTRWAWGENSVGQLGDGTTANKNTPTQIGTDNNWVSIAAGESHTMALKSDGTLLAWGYNAYGQLGDGTTVNKTSPVQIMQAGTGNEWGKISAGSYHTLALKSDGTLWAWGYNAYGQLGDGNNTGPEICGSDACSTTPLQIGTDNKWVSISAGGNHTIALKSDGTLWAWGRNAEGQLGDGTTINKTSPVQIGTDKNWVSVSAGSKYTVALKSDGTLWAWGDNFYGQLGDGTTVNKSSPVQIGTDNKWVAIEAGATDDAHTLALKSDGTLWAWGYNYYGQLGDGTTIARYSPTQIGTDNKWVSITAGGWHTIALKSDGTLWAWGNNDSGQLGDGTTSNNISPVQIGIDNNWVFIATRDKHTVALKSDGTLWAWGKNDYGQLGDGTTSNKTSPVQIGIDNNWVFISTGGWEQVGPSGGYTVALKSDGTLWAWGYNSSGQLGDGTTANKYTPTRIGSDTTPPTGTISINSGATYTNSTSVTLTLTCTDGGPNLESIASVYDPSPPGDIALNTSATGTPSPLESDAGWGGGSYPWEIVDGKRTYPEWYHGLAFCGGTGNWCGQACGWRQATIDFSAPKTFNEVVVWHHGFEHFPNTYKIQYWDGTSWVDIFSTTTGHDYLVFPSEGWSPTRNAFAPVTASKVRYTLNNCDIEHGWIYEFEVYNSGSGCSEMQFSNDNVTYSTPESYATSKAWTLTSGDGTKTVYVKFKDNANNWSDAYSDTIILQTTYALTVTKTGTGSGTVTSSLAGIDCGSDCSEVYTSGTIVTLSPTSDTGSTFTGWSGDADCSDGQVTMDADKTCTATFTTLPAGTIYVYDNEASFISAVSPLVLVDFENIDTSGGKVAFSGNEYSAQGISFSSPSIYGLWIYLPNGYWNSKLLSPGEQPYEGYGDGDLDSLTINFNPHVNAIGWTFVDLGGGTNEGIKVYAEDNSIIYEQSYLQGSGIGAGNNPFWGIFSPEKPIARVEIIEAENDGDDVAYDNFKFSYATTLQTYTLTVNKAGTGSGAVTSSPAGISCGSDCSETYDYNTTVTLTASASTGSTFEGWSGDADCSDGQVTMDADKGCIATFTLLIPDISSSTSSLNFGNVNVGVTSASQTVTVTNVGTANLSISAVTLTGTNSSEYIKQVDACAGNTLPPSENCNVQIVFTPASAGAKTAGLAITSNDPDTPTLNIPLSGTGVQPSTQQPEEPMSVVLSCQTNVTAGNALTVTVKLYNYDCTNSVSVNRLMTQLMGNSSGTLMGLGIWGPYNKSIATKTVPQATCDEFGNVTPGGPVSFSLTIMSQTPTSLSGKMAEVTVDAITSKGESIGSGSCMVNVQ